MSHLLKYVTLSLLLLLIFVSCKKEKSVTIAFQTDIDKQYSTVVNGRKTIFNNLKIYFSNIQLITTNKDTILIKEVFLFDLKRENQIIFSNKQNFEIEQIRIGIGLDSTKNNMMPNTFESTHPLSIENGMYWSMLKYRFLSTEGALDSSIQKNQNPNFPFSLHLGRNEIYQTKIFNLQHSIQNGNIKIKINYHKMFQDGEISIDCKNYFSNHSEGYEMNDAKMLFNNLCNGIEISIIK